MLRSVRVFQPVPGDPDEVRSAFIGDPGRWLPGARQIGPARWATTVHAGRLTREVAAHVGGPWRSGSTWWRSLSWEPKLEDTEADAVERFLPSLDGELGLHAVAGVVTLMLDGRYRPPGGAVGAALDAVALQRVARATAHRLLRDVSSRLCAESVLSPRTDTVLTGDADGRTNEDPWSGA